LEVSRNASDTGPPAYFQQIQHRNQQTHGLHRSGQGVSHLSFIPIAKYSLATFGHLRHYSLVIGGQAELI
jgi:hypothetical protein